MVGSAGDSLTTINDNTEDIFSDLTVDWKTPDDQWQNSPDNEILWQDDELRWTVTLPPEEVPFREELTSLKLLQRPHENSLASWVEVPLQSFEPNPNNLAQFFIYAHPVIGDWDITVHGLFGMGVNAWLAAPKHRPATGIQSVVWEKFDADQRLYYDGGDYTTLNSVYFGPRVYPEFNKPPELVPNQSANDRVKVRVTLAMAPPVGFVADVFLKDYDPDNSYNPLLPIDAGPGFHDPDDEVRVVVAGDPFATPPTDDIYGTVINAEDNRGAGGATGGTFLNSHITIAALASTEVASYKITATQPGNNYRVGASGHELWVNAGVLAPDGVTILRKAGGTPAGLNGVTDTMTVWRTLHIEQDSMDIPPNELQEEFNLEDPNPGHSRNPSLSLLPVIFNEANIDVAADLDPYDTGPFSDDIAFRWNIAEEQKMQPDGDAFAEANMMRKVSNSGSFWAVQVVGAYEGSAAQDHDDNTEAAELGANSYGEIPLVWIFLETIRDRAANPVLPAYPPTVPEAILESRVVVHEVAHTFLGGHAPNLDDPTNEGIMKASILAYAPAEQFRLNSEQIGIIQSKYQPRGVPQ